MKSKPIVTFHSAYSPFLKNNSTLCMSAKFLEVLMMWDQLWPGEIRYLVEPAAEQDIYMTQEVDLTELPFDTRIIDRASLSKELFSGTDVVLAALEGGLPDLHNLVPEDTNTLVYYADISPDVEWELTKVELSVKSLRLLRQLRARKNWEASKKRKIASLERSAGIQSNQFGCANYYKQWLQSSMVYIDTRMTVADAVDPSIVEKKQKRYLEEEPLRLCYSGRITEIKNPLALVEVSKVLKQKSIKHSWTIFGDGPLLQNFKDAVSEAGLKQEFSFEGFIDSKTEMTSRMAQEIDAFVIPHTQGDTSCTYAEVLFAGVPIVSYPNSAIKALNEHFGIATLTESFDPKALAQEIAQFDSDRQALLEKASSDYLWGKNQTMEKAYGQRVEHLLEVYKNNR